MAIFEHAVGTTDALIPGRMCSKSHGRTRADRAFTLVEIMIVVAIIGLLVALALPAFAKARRTSQMQKCLESQRLIYGAVQRYEMENTTTLQSIKNDGDAIRNTLLGSGYINTKDAFECPSSGNKDYDDILLSYAGNDFINTSCSILPAVHVLQ